MLDDSQLPPTVILHLLADGQVHSGQELADLMGVSRTAIWKQLAKLEALGIKLQSQAGKGYCIEGGLDLLDIDQIKKRLDDPSLSIRLHQLIDSTNAEIMRIGMTGGLEICLAECQTAGRGRRGRVWVSPFARNVYISLGMTLESGVGALEGMSLGVGVAVARALADLGMAEVQLKWPNDILWKMRKLGGVLIEITGDPSGRCHLVVGLGLNIYPDASMATAIDQPWVSLAEAYPQNPSRNVVVASLLNRLVPLLETFETSGFLPYRSAWEALNAHNEQLVDLHLGNKVVCGRVKGITEAGALLLETESRELQVFHGGEVSLRSANDIGT